MNTPVGNPLQNFKVKGNLSNILNKTRNRVLRLVYGVDSPPAESLENVNPPTSTSPHLSSTSNDLSGCSSPESYQPHCLNDTPIISRLSRSVLYSGVSNNSTTNNTPSLDNFQTPGSQSRSQPVVNQDSPLSDPAAEVSRIIRSAVENALTSFLENPTNENNSQVHGLVEDALHQLENPTVSALSTLRQFASCSQSQAPLDFTVHNSCVQTVPQSISPVVCSSLCFGNKSFDSSPVVTSCGFMNSQQTVTTTSMCQPVSSIVPLTSVSSVQTVPIVHNIQTEYSSSLPHPAASHTPFSYHPNIGSQDISGGIDNLLSRSRV